MTEHSQPSHSLFNADAIYAAAARIAPYAVHTPLLNSQQLDDLAGCRIFVKAECLQKTGSFKFRGALNRLLTLTPEQRARGVVTYSVGNHAQGVAAGAGLLKCPAIVIMPRSAPAIKIENTRWWGAEVVLFDPYTETREALAQQLMAERGMTFVSPFDDHEIMAGQGTAGLEACAQIQALNIRPDMVLTSCSGGGLSAGVFTAMRHHFPEIECGIVEPAGGEKMAWSLQSGQPERVSTPLKTIMDGIAGPAAGSHTLRVLLQQNVRAMSVDDTQAMRALSAAFRYLKIVLEPAGAAGLAAVLSDPAHFKGKNIVVIASGANVEEAVFKAALA